MRKNHQSFWLLSLAVITYWRYAIFNAIYPKLCYLLYHIPRSSAIFFLKVMLQYIILTPSYANSSYAMFSGQSWGRISGYCCNGEMVNLESFRIWQHFFLVSTPGTPCWSRLVQPQECTGHDLIRNSQVSLLKHSGWLYLSQTISGI